MELMPEDKISCTKMVYEQVIGLNIILEPVRWKKLLLLRSLILNVKLKLFHWLNKGKIKFIFSHERQKIVYEFGNLLNSGVLPELEKIKKKCRVISKMISLQISFNPNIGCYIAINTSKTNMRVGIL